MKYAFSSRVGVLERRYHILFGLSQGFGTSAVIAFAGAGLWRDSPGMTALVLAGIGLALHLVWRWSYRKMSAEMEREMDETLAELKASLEGPPRMDA